MDIEIKLRTILLGQHRHVTVFTGPAGMTLGNSGSLVVREEHWGAFRAIIEAGAWACGVRLTMTETDNIKDMEAVGVGP